MAGTGGETGHGRVGHSSYASVMSGQQRCGDREFLIRVIPRPQSIAICNLESAVSPHLTVSLLIVTTCIVKC